MKTATIRSSWMPGYGFRMDCQPYLGGALETKILLEKLSFRKDKLHTLTAGFDGGIYNGPKFPRTYVDSPEFGVPFVGSSSMLYADLSDLPLLSKKQAESRMLRHLELKPGMSLISCSGTIGKMAYARPDMVGMWSSQHVLKIVADTSKILPGYLYAFLSSKFGVPLVVSGTYGSIIPSIGPDHVKDLPVPRIGDALEREIHTLVEKAADSLSEHSRLLETATTEALKLSEIPDLPRHLWNKDLCRLGWSQSGIRTDSLRALNYDCRISGHFQRIRDGRHSKLGELCEPEFFRGRTVFTRIDASDEYGVKLVGQREAFRVWPEGRTIAKTSIAKLGLLVPPGSTLIPSHGTFGEFELYCRSIYVTKRTSKYAFSGDFFRCVPRKNSIPAGYLFAFIRSEVAFRMLRSISAGGKQQEQHSVFMHELPIPRLSDSEEKRISSLVDDAAEKFDRALNCEEQARNKLERAITDAQ